MSFWVLLTLVNMAMAQQPDLRPMDEFVDDLLARMTLDEKIGQLNLQVAGDITTGAAQDTEVSGLIAEGRMGGIFNLKGVDEIRSLQSVAVNKSRLGIPLIVGMDVIHGYETIFPIPLAMSCSWDLDAIEQAAAIAAKEASADGINWVYSPMVDVSLDARWGRSAEGNGEDPFLGSEIGKAYIRGYQGGSAAGGEILSADHVMSCVKHFALYGAVEAGRDYNTVDMSHLRMFNQYFPPYKAAVEAGAGSVMTSFNLVDGQHATANRWLLDDVLRGLWHFVGFTVTDYGSIGEMRQHGFGGMADNARKAFNAGTDMDMCSQAFLSTLRELVMQGRVSEEDIDKACRRVLEAKYRLGLFQDPYRHLDKARRKHDIYTAAHREHSRRLATESFVLLKNDKQLLPLKRHGKIALIGPLADDRANIAGTWCVAYTPERYATIRECMQRRLESYRQRSSETFAPDYELLYAQGCNLTRDPELQKAAEFGKTIPRVDDAQAMEEAVRLGRQADAIVCAMGECADMSGESSSRATLELPDVQRELLERLVGLGKPVVLLNFSGRATVLSWEDAHVDAIMNVWFGGSEAGDAICDVLFGETSPSGKLTVSMPRSVGQCPIYYNHLNTGRPVPENTDRYYKYSSNYLEVRNDPLYPFGFGLSYTTFMYGDLRLSYNGEGQPVVSVQVANTGDMDADEVVQLYIHDIEAEVSRPVKELKGFRRVHLMVGERADVSFTVTKEMLSYYDAVGNMVFEPGRFELMVGSDSRSVQKVEVSVE